jgi:uncharacterized protein YaiI (UPF0178 family)
MRIWIDADATPGDIKEIVLRASQRLRVETILVANKNVGIGEGELVSLVRVDAGPDVADAYIVEHGQAGDFAITADIPLAARLVEKGLTVIDPRGELYSAESIGERLAMRDFMADLRASGVQTGGPAPFSHADRQAFANALDRLLASSQR